MPTFIITAPDGKKYKVSAPEGTTREQALERVKQQAERKPESFWQGVGEGLSDVAYNAARFIEKNPAVDAGGRLAGMAMDMAQGRTPSLDSSITKTARRETRKAFARTGKRGSEGGKIVGGLLGTLPTLGVASPVVAGALAGGLLTRDPDDTVGVARDALIGGATGKVADMVLRGGGSLIRKGGQAAAEPMGRVAQRLGVRPTPATVGGPGRGVVQRLLSNIPGSSSAVAAGVSRETDDLAAAAMNVGNALGPISTPARAGESLAKGAQAYSKATKRAGGALYKARNNLIGGEDAPVLMGSTAQEIRSLAGDFPNMSASFFEHPAVRKLAAAMPDGPEPQLTVKETAEALSHMRGALRNAERSNTITGPLKARIARVEQSIEDDLMRAAQSADAIAGRAPEQGAAAAQRAADKYWAQRSQTLSGPLATAKASADDPVRVSGEKVFRQFVDDMKLQGGNIARLRQAWGALPKAQRRTFAATAFDQLGRAKPGVSTIAPDALAEGAETVADTAADWSFNTFLTNYKALSPDARRLVFGGKGVDQQIDDIARYSARLRELGQMRNPSNTYNRLAEGGLSAVYLGVIGNELFQGDIAGAAKTAALLPAAALIGKGFMATPAGRLWLRNATRTLATKGGTPAGEASLRKLTRQLPVIAQANPAIRQEAQALFAALESKAGVPVLASDGEENQGE